MITARSLSRHRATIHGVNRRNFVCTVCNRNFSRNDALQDHRRNVHTGADTPEQRCRTQITRRHTKEVLAQGIVTATLATRKIKKDCVKDGKALDPALDHPMPRMPKAAKLRAKSHRQLVHMHDDAQRILEAWKNFAES